MAIAVRYMGEDVYFTIKRRASNNTYRNLDSYTDIFVYVSNGGNVIKFSKNAKTGYQLLTRVTATEYAAFLTSANTASLDIGHIYISCDFVESSLVSDGRINTKSTDIAMRFDFNPINSER